MFRPGIAIPADHAQALLVGTAREAEAAAHAARLAARAAADGEIDEADRAELAGEARNCAQQPDRAVIGGTGGDVLAGIGKGYPFVAGTIVDLRVRLAARRLAEA
jgi:hypothetical protein